MNMKKHYGCECCDYDPRDCFCKVRDLDEGDEPERDRAEDEYLREERNREWDKEEK